MPDNALRVIPLGGLGEIGQNMMALEYGDDIVVIDAGVLFPEEDMPGIDFGIPDITFLRENEDRVRAILITHGHEDHIGALPYVLPELDVPVYASRLTHGLISVKLRERGLLKNADLQVVEPLEPFTVGCFGVEFFRVCHSIPDAMGIAITTPVGLVIHTGDFKIDHTPADGQSTDFAALSQIADNGVLLLCSDSTYAEVEGYTASEQVVGEALDRAIGDAKGRVMIATFASLISRIQQVINAAVRSNRKVTVVGRSMQNNVKMAINMGYLAAPPGTVITMAQARQLPLEEVVIVATGSQGEPTSALVRIANGEHQDIEIVAGDTVIISASPIPGNETVIAKTIDNLFRQGAHVLYSRIAMVHVHGHASQEELKMMLSLVRPRFFVPIHGEHRHLVRHAMLASSIGVPESNSFVLEDGDVLELTAERGEVVGSVPAGHVFVDGQHFWSRHSSVLGERRRLAREGVVTVSVTLDSRTGLPVGPPNIASVGFVELNDSQDLFEKTSKITASHLEEMGPSVLNLEQVKAAIRKSVSDFLYKETRRRPTVLATVEKV
ncbi:MAG: ribonuclease J [SAR202 cluster bacterium]|jgi:ribonuclease J|nr:ribonuclease J [Chloroflexota bacterium]MDP6422274.1 ribonuclease J [SAR202 cluster bacterium]HAL48218.1 ribonuclease J [Dehalococcoidia bacterium]MDP6665550.1 ribonuclease J [SAR202 cluster bacterium]MDP6799503.1 ribonuclease J [SAR202 cluster bacterium]|tara:strand:+ start:7698 stop:9356 length:1659 start_codon:yes stop_codon:yes gene_type:complete